MKKLLLIFLLFCALIPVQAQWITGMHVVPDTPSSADNVRLIVQAQFPSGGCSEWYIMNQYQVDFEYTYSIVNCVGMLAVICPNNDTITMGQLIAGNYTVIVNLNAGSGDKPCPPFAQWTADTIHFIVSPATGLPETKNTEATIMYYSVQASQAIMVSLRNFKEPATLEIYDIAGRLLSAQTVVQAKTQINISSLAAGIYVLKAFDRDGVSAVKFVKE